MKYNHEVMMSGAGMDAFGVILGLVLLADLLLLGVWLWKKVTEK